MLLKHFLGNLERGVEWYWSPQLCSRTQILLNFSQTSQNLSSVFLCQMFRDITPSQSNNWVTSGVSGLSLHHSKQMHPKQGLKIRRSCSALSFEQLPDTALDLHHLTVQSGSPNCQIQGLCPEVHSTELFSTNPSTGGKTVGRRLRNSGKERHFTSSQISRNLGSLVFSLLCCQGVVHLLTAWHYFSPSETSELQEAPILSCLTEHNPSVFQWKACFSVKAGLMS